ncbi:MAG TPA: trypsin-like peptidase domain-containing protein [Patescibacteria group bacterium]|jgi:S1-C subfamily serine protease|nr:trypsin-like peptidase domain-containing protein [Patescibacteria group bacterium]
MTDSQKQGQKKILHVVAIVTAWITVPVLGLLLLSITTYGSRVKQIILTRNENPDIFILPLNALLGIMLITLLLILVHRYRTKTYIFHLRIGLFIGIGIYALMFLAAIAADISPQKASELDVCTSPRDQYMSRGDAIVPISTDLGSGTGFAIDSKGTILTAYHVVKGAKSINASYSSGEQKMKLIDKAPQYDLALLKLSKPTSSYFILSDTYTTGDNVFAYGYPGNSLTAGPPSLSTGIVSRVVDIASLRMTVQSAPDGLELIQTDAAINPGNSGGPLIGGCGVIGIVSFVSDTSALHKYTGSVSEQNIGFAISARTAEAAFPKRVKLK